MAVHPAGCFKMRRLTLFDACSRDNIYAFQTSWQADDVCTQGLATTNEQEYALDMADASGLHSNKLKEWGGDDQ